MAPFRVGVLFEANQLSDIVGIDLIGSCSTEYIATTSDFGFDYLLPLATDIEFLYVSSTLEPARTTPSVYIVPTHTYDNCPTDLDLVILGGPLLSHRPEASLKFLREAAKHSKIIMTTCVGSLWLADSGVLKGRKATTNRFAIPLGQKLHPEIDWVDQRWVVDDNGEGAAFWTAGAAGCGIDMIALFTEQRFGKEISMAARYGLELCPGVPEQFYSGPMPSFGPPNAQASKA